MIDQDTLEGEMDPNAIEGDEEPAADGIISLDDLRPPAAVGPAADSKRVEEQAYSFFHIDTDSRGKEREYGPYPLSELPSMIEAGLITAKTWLYDKDRKTRRAINFPSLQKALLTGGLESDQESGI